MQYFFMQFDLKEEVSGFIIALCVINSNLRNNLVGLQISALPIHYKKNSTHISP